MKNLVRVSKAKGLPFKPQTFYKWYHLKKYPEIFIKFGGALFVDLERLEQLIDASRGQRERVEG
jgi:hypothetical protein